ncbi:MAG TPA: ABC transporter substrate-binding protein [Acidimicrobiia bacterium]
MGAIALAAVLAAACGASPRVQREVAAARQVPVAAFRGTADTGDALVRSDTPPISSEPRAAPTSAGTDRASRPSADPIRQASQASTSVGSSPGATAVDPAAPAPGSVTTGSLVPQAVPQPVEGNGGETDVGVTATSIKIGGTFLNGSYLDRYSQVSEQAAAAYFRYINDQGGIYGRRIEFVTCDTAGTASGTQSCLRKLAAADKVFALGPSVDLNLDTVQPFLEQQQLPWVGSSGAYPEEFSSPWMFPTQVAGVDVGALMGKFAKQALGVATVGVSYLDDVAGPECVERVRQIGEQIGYRVVATAQNSQTQGDLSQQVITIQTAQPDIVLFCNDPINTIKFVQAAGRMNYRPAKGWVGGFVASDDVPRSMGAAGVGFYGFSSYDFYGGDQPGIVQFRRITEHYYPSIFHHFYSQAAYVGSMAVVEALKRAGPQLTRQGLLAALRSITDFDSTMGLRLNFADPRAGMASGVMLQADRDLRWKLVSDRFTL